MDYTTLGNTGLKVSVAALGCGGNSKLGIGAGKSETEAVRLVEVAYDLGITFFDTAESYKTAPILGKALKGIDRKNIVLSSKCNIGHANSPRSGNEVINKLEEGLRELKTDYVDILHMHGVHPTRYDQVVQDILPSLERAKMDGKVRYLGITETSPNDPTHEMLKIAINDDFWSVVMLGYNMMNLTAHQSLFPTILKRKLAPCLCLWCEIFLVNQIICEK